MRAAVERDEVVRRRVERRIGAGAKASPWRGEEITDVPERQRVDPRVHMPVVESFWMESEPEDLFPEVLDPPVSRVLVGRAEIPFEQVAVGAIVEAVVFDVAAPRDERVERPRRDLAPEADRRRQPRLVVWLEPFRLVQVTA